MKKKIKELRAKITEFLARMDEIHNLTITEERKFTDKEQVEYDGLKVKVDEVNEKITEIEEIEEERSTRATELAAEREKLEKPIREIKLPDSSGRNEVIEPDEFKSFGEFLYSIRFRPQDSRLLSFEDTLSPDELRGYEMAMARMSPEEREQSMGVGAEGGFAVPDQFMDTLLQVSPQDAIVRPRATVIPAGFPPDAPITIPALNQTAAQNVYGGVTVNWIGEGATKPETDLELLYVKLTPHEVAGWIRTTDKLLRNWAAAGPLLETQLRGAMIGAEDTTFLTGTGVGQPTGIIGSPGSINVARAGAGAIVYADLLNMLLVTRPGFTYIWIGSPDIRGQLMGIVDPGAAGTLIWQMNAQEGMPGILMGKSIFFNERSPTLGVRGDLILVDLAQYLIKDGSGPFVGISSNVGTDFIENKTVVKVFKLVDGAPWLSAPIPQENAAATALTAYAVLEA